MASTSSQKRKRVSVPFKEKLEALNRLDNGETMTKVASDMGVGRVTVGDWKRNRTKIEEWCSKMDESIGLDARSRMQLAENQILDEVLFIWFLQHKKKGTLMSGPILRAKALKINKKLGGDTNFTASEGWLDRWKKRHGIKKIKSYGEKFIPNPIKVVHITEKFLKFLGDERLTMDQVFNCDQTGIYYKMLPSKSEHIDLKIKKRITVLACSNTSGSLKLPLMVIGKSRAVEQLNLPVFYKSQKNSIVDSKIFKEWFRTEFVPRVRIFMKDAGLPPKALLIINNASYQTTGDILKDEMITAMFFPPNVSSALHPMNLEVLENLKRQYCYKLLNSLLETLDEKQGLNLKSISIKDAIYWLAESWDKVPQTLLKKSWQNGGHGVELLIKNLEKNIKCENEHFEQDEEISNKNFLEILHHINGLKDINETDLNHWFEKDKSDDQFLSDEQIISRVLENQQDDEDEDNEEGCIYTPFQQLYPVVILNYH